MERAFGDSGLPPDRFEYWEKPGPPTPLRSFRSADRVFTVALSAAGRDRLLVEQQCRRWATDHDIPVPAVRAAAADGTWLVADHITVGPPQGSPYVVEALRIADRISSCPLPRLTRSAAVWRGPRRTLPARLIRQTRGGLSLPRLRRARAAARDLTDRAPAHGDYYRRNVLADRAGGVSVVDWEFIGSAPRFTDHLRLWSTLRDDADRKTAWAVITADLDEPRRHHVAVLGEYLVLRLLGENLAAPDHQRDPADLAHARLMVSEWPDYRGTLVSR